MENDKKIDFTKDNYLIVTSVETNKTAEQYNRLKESPTVFINRAIEMLKDNGINTGLYNGVVSLLQYAKESDEFSTQQSKEKDERIKALEFVNEEVRKKYDLACDVIAEQNEEIKRLIEALTELVADLKADRYNHRLGTMDKVNKALNQ